MVNYEQGLPNILFKSTLVLELIAFLSSHLIDNRNEPTLHEGLLSRCIYPKKLGEGMGLEYHCLWWSFDTFMTDRGFFCFCFSKSNIYFFIYNFNNLELITFRFFTIRNTASIPIDFSIGFHCDLRCMDSF